MSWVPIVGLAVLAVSAQGCSRCGDRHEPAASATSAEPAPPPTASPPTRPRLERSRPTQAGRQPRRIESITVAESAAVLPVPEGARVLAGPSKPSNAERVQATYCFEGATPAAAAQAIARSLEASGWSKVHLRTVAEQDAHAALAAQQPPYRVSASVRRVPAPRCNGDAGHAYATVTLHKVSGVRATKATRPSPEPQHAPSSDD